MVEDSKLKYELKKQLRRLHELKGSGTELISVYLPAGSQVHDMSNKLKEELGQASNIKSKSTRKNVMDALERVIHYLKMFMRGAPENGIAIFCGNVSENPAKTDIELFSIVPPQPIQVQLYRCDSKFFLEPLDSILAVKDSYGLVVLDGREATLAALKGTQVSILKRLNSTAHAKIRKGGQCLAPETLVQLESGEIREVGGIFEDIRLKGADFTTNLIGSRDCSDVFMSRAKKCLAIRTREPAAEILATPYHRFFRLGEYGFEEVFAKRLKPGDLVAMAGSIRHEGRKVETGFIGRKRAALGAGERARLRRRRIGLGLSQQRAGALIGVSQMAVCRMEDGKIPLSLGKTRELYRAYGLEFDEKFGKGVLAFPRYYTRELAQLFGMICGDGNAGKNRVTIYEGKEEMVSEYEKLIEKAIGIECVVRKVDKTKQRGSFAKKPYFELRIYSWDFEHALREIAPEIICGSDKRSIPDAILRCENDVCAAFLRGLFDAEGYIHGANVEIAGIGRGLFQKAQMALLRFGIRASFSRKDQRGSKRQQWSLKISDRPSLARFAEHIGFTRSDKRRSLGRICSMRTAQQYVSRMPVDGREVFRLAKSLGLKTSDFHAANCFFRGIKPLGRATFGKSIAPVLLKKAEELGRLEEVKQTIARWLEGDVALAKVSEIRELERNDFYFDLTIPVYSNFVANSFIVHNSARRYERLIEETIERYYQRVGEAMDQYFVTGVKGVIIGGPGPTKDMFIKSRPFNYQIKVLGVVDTGYVDDYGIRELMAKSDSLISEQEAVKEKRLVDRFIKEVVKGGLAAYGEEEVRTALVKKQAELLLVSEGLAYKRFRLKCSSCGAEEQLTTAKDVEEVARMLGKAGEEGGKRCAVCSGKLLVEGGKLLVDDLIDIATENNIQVEVVSQDTTEGSQFLQSFYGIGAFLRYK